ncbi:hypothetical protein R1sor_011572 [Riccia sorocarpa]|uniref:DDE Tnp4 domain-containing protein n=1 Tax=Riccia sorocarpa TaxID=122646 RepID=A0ABD3GZX0_9MARC
MVNYTNRVMIALRDRLGNLISWPDEMERRRISASFAEKGFPGCVGLIDGTLIPLSQRPRDGGETYHDRKNRYSYNAQVVSDDRRKIIFLFAGMPGSCADITCLRKCKLYDQLHTGSWFSAEEYLLGDSGYTPLPRLVPGYRYSSRHRDKEEFNNCLAHARVVNEHTIGVLKSRWHSLRELRCQIKNRRCAKYAMRWISCCAILHNFLINKDEWTEEDDEIILEPPAQLTETDRQAYVKDSPEARDAGIRLRDRIQSICLAINRRPGGYLNRFQDFI